MLEEHIGGAYWLVRSMLVERLGGKRRSIIGKDGNYK